MVRSFFSTFASVAVACGALAGCTIITNPPPAGAPPPATGNRSNVPVVGATPATPATPVAATPAAVATTAPAANGPKVTVDGKQYTTLVRPVAFGSGDNRSAPFKGFVYFTPGTNTTLPNFDATTPVGVLFASGFAVSAATYTEGFPGLDAARVDHFAIRYEGSFLVPAQGDYVFKLESDDGSRFVVDNLPLLSNDGIHTAQAKTASVKLSPGPHNFRLEYFQGARSAVSLRLSVTPPGGAEKAFGPVI